MRPSLAWRPRWLQGLLAKQLFFHWRSGLSSWEAVSYLVRPLAPWYDLFQLGVTFQGLWQRVLSLPSYWRPFLNFTAGYCLALSWARVLFLWLPYITRPLVHLDKAFLRGSFNWKSQRSNLGPSCMTTLVLCHYARALSPSMHVFTISFWICSAASHAMSRHCCLAICAIVCGWNLPETIGLTKVGEIPIRPESPPQFIRHFN